MVDDALEDRRLRAYTDKNTAKFLPEVRRAKVVSVYDGDTPPLQQDMQSEVRHDYSRYALRGLTPRDSWIKRSRKGAAVAARDWLRQRVLGKPVTLENVSLEKYGRVLATVKHRGTDLSSSLWMRVTRSSTMAARSPSSRLARRLI